MNNYEKIHVSVSAKVLQALMALVVILSCVILFSGIKAHAAGSVSITEINYDKNTITIQLGTADNVLLMSNDKQLKWELVPIAPDVNHRVVLDISWIPATKENTISFKGDVSTTPIKVKIPKSISSLKVTYSINKGKVTFQNADGRTVQWKKADSISSWIDYDPDAFEIQVAAFIANGAKLSFRLAPENGTSENNPGVRPGKSVLVSIPKKIASPNITINDAMVAIPLNEGCMYREVDKYGNEITQWTEISKKDEYLISALAPQVMADQLAGTEGTTVYLQFKTKRTSSAQESNVKTVKIPGQQPLSDEEIAGMGIIYTSATTLNINVTAGKGGKYTYEYCIIKNNDTSDKNDISDGLKIGDYKKLKWTELTGGTASATSSSSGNNPNVGDGSLIYVRRKAYKAQDDSEYEIASPAICLTATGVKYPGDISTGSGLVWLSTVAGVCTPANPTGYLTFTILSPTDNYIEKLEFIDFTSKASRGTLTHGTDFKSTVAPNPSPVGSDDKYIITTTIMNTSKLDSYSVLSGSSHDNTRKMIAKITLKDGEAWSSTKQDGIGLYIFPATVLANPSTGEKQEIEAEEIMASVGAAGYDYDNDIIKFGSKFVRVVDSLRTYANRSSYSGDWDATEFRFVLDFGTRYNPEIDADGDAKAAGDGTEVMLTKIKYDGVTFMPNDGSGVVTVQYGDISSDPEKGAEEIRRAVVTINADLLENNTSVDDRNSDTPVIIYLSNGEILKNQVTLNLQETATIKGGSSAWTITAGSLTETDTVTDSEGNTTTKDHVDRSITLTGNSTTSTAALISVKWFDGAKYYEVCSNIGHTGNEYTMDLSNKLLNKIQVAGTTSNYLIFEFDNGFKIKTGWKLTINPGNSMK